MTQDQNTRCHAIIHTAAVAAGGCNALPLPGMGIAADTLALAGMAAGLASVFGKDLPSNVAKAMAVEALRKTVLRQPLKVIGKELSKLIPFLGSAFAATVSVGLVEAAGWSLVSEFESEAA